ncbi:Endonuclease/exonuclease/phosphatase [Infundibulicybe gibba]|nr:Endonuclease/exonuclease/phosphatase [Infundibulicybe gibba]
MAIQETHLNEERITNIHSLFNKRMHIINSNDAHHPNAKGIAIILNKSTTKWKEMKSETIIPGRAILATLPWHGENKLKILAIYAPNTPTENANFWEEIKNKWNIHNYNKPDIILGDFNMTPRTWRPPRPVEALREIKNKFNLVDGWRTENPTKLEYTFRALGTGIQSRIDRIYMTNANLKNSYEWENQISPLNTDHKMISVRIFDPKSPNLGKGRWAIPNFLIKDKTIAKEIKRMGVELEEKISATKDARTDTNNPQILFQAFKSDMTKYIRNHARTVVPKTRVRIKKLEEELSRTKNSRRP